MPQFNNLSSDRIMAIRVFDGEIRKIKALYGPDHVEWKMYQTVIKYLESRIESMEDKGHYAESDRTVLHKG